MCMHYMLTMDFRKGESSKRRKNTQEIKTLVSQLQTHSALHATGRHRKTSARRGHSFQPLSKVHEQRRTRAKASEPLYVAQVDFLAL